MTGEGPQSRPFDVFPSDGHDPNKSGTIRHFGSESKALKHITNTAGGSVFTAAARSSDTTNNQLIDFSGGGDAPIAPIAPIAPTTELCRSFPGSTPHVLDFSSNLNGSSKHLCDLEYSRITSF